ncbi:MAG: nitric-oxide reductase large subunit, partial [Ideonella sp.]|nr:nitric-oxide reductase large subunit [Ideonella sp.]
MMSNQRLWRWLALIFVLSFGALGFIGYQIHLSAPPIPRAVVSADGSTLFTGEQIRAGQRAWLASGGQQQGSVWGHGSYVAPDWSADWLHREAVALQAIRTQQHTTSLAPPTATERAAIDDALKREMRHNGYDPATDTLTVGVERARAIRATAAHYEALFGSDPALATLRGQYAMTAGELPVRADRDALTAFFF